MFYVWSGLISKERGYLLPTWVQKRITLLSIYAPTNLEATERLISTSLHSSVLPPLPNQTNQGIDCILPGEAEKLAGRDPDYAIKDLFESIASDNFVSAPRPSGGRGRTWHSTIAIVSMLWQHSKGRNSGYMYKLRTIRCCWSKLPHN